MTHLLRLLRKFYAIAMFLHDEHNLYEWEGSDQW